MPEGNNGSEFDNTPVMTPEEIAALDDEPATLGDRDDALGSRLPLGILNKGNAKLVEAKQTRQRQEKDKRATKLAGKILGKNMGIGKVDLKDNSSNS